MRRRHAAWLALLALAAAGLVLAVRSPGPGPAPLLAAHPWDPGAPALSEAEVARDRRGAWTFASPGRLAWTARVPEGARLRLALHVDPPDAPVRLRLASGGRVLLDEPWKGGGWQERDLDLAGLGGPGLVFEALAEGGAATVRLGNPTLLGPPGGPDRPNVVLYLVDCLRADHVGAYGYERPTTPEIDALAGEGVVFESVHACASWTKPSVGCLFTSHWPWAHGARTVEDAVADGLPTLAERFRAAGFATAAWLANPFVGSPRFGLSRGFERVVQTLDLPQGSNINDLPADAADITRPVVDWLSRNRDRRFFLYVHSLDLHESYRRRPGFAPRFLSPERTGTARQVDLYDNELAYNDREIGRLVEALRSQGILDRTVFAVTSDHGEEFGEHGHPNHGHSLYQALLHVPLVVRLPHAARGRTRVASLASALDVGPTLLDLAGLGAPPGTEGRSLMPLADGAPGRELLPAEQVGSRDVLYAVRNRRFKRIRRLLPEPREELFDLVADPEETRNLLPEVPEEARGLERELSAMVQRGLGGFSLALAAPPGERVVVEVETAGTIGSVQHVPIRIGDAVEVSGDRRRLTFSFPGEARHLVVPVEPPESGLTVRGTRGGRPLGTAEVGLGPRATAPAAVPFLALPGDVAASAEEAVALLERAAPVLRVWHVAPPRGSRKVTLDPELQQQLRALGYVQ